jgi:UbiD family decarboxylase
MKEEKNYLKKIYGAAVAAGLCSTQKEFAELLEVDRTSLSAAMNGNPRNLTTRFLAKVEKFAKQYKLDGEPAPEPPKKQIVIPEETLELYTNLSETCRNLSAILARMGLPTGGLGLEGYGTKKDHLLNNEG